MSHKGNSSTRWCVMYMMPMFHVLIMLHTTYVWLVKRSLQNIIKHIVQHGMCSTWKGRCMSCACLLVSGGDSLWASCIPLSRSSAFRGWAELFCLFRWQGYVTNNCNDLLSVYRVGFAAFIRRWHACWSFDNCKIFGTSKKVTHTEPFSHVSSLQVSIF